MADFTAIYSVGNSIANYLGSMIPPPLKKLAPNLNFQLVASSQIAQEDQANLDQVVTIFLHRITLNENFRSATRVQDDPTKKALLYLDLHYLITYWGADPQAEQTIIGWTMAQLQSMPILDNSVLTPASIWDPSETIQLTPADLSLEDTFRIWDALGPNYRLSVSYIARVVRIDATVSPEPPVLATRFTVEQIGVAQ